MNINQLNSDAKEYFDRLPANVQEQIMQTGLSFTSKAQLEDYFNSVLSSGEDR